MQVSSVAAKLLCLCLLSGPKPPVQIVIEEDPTAVAFPTGDSKPAARPASANPPATRPPGQQLQQEEVVRQLHVQTALREGRKLVAGGKFAEAIGVLEPPLAWADGSETYLEVLAEAYRGQIADCLRERQVDHARQLTDRLRILASADRLGDSIPTSGPPPTTAATNPELTNADWVAQPSDQAAPAASANDSAAATRKPIEAAPTPPVPEDLKQAEKLYAEKRYAAALPFYEKAYEADPLAVQAVRERWGYCLLYVCYERYNDWRTRPAAAVSDRQWDQLIADLDQCCVLAPSQKKYRDDAVAAITAHRKSLAAADSVAQAAPAGRPNLYNSLATGSAFTPRAASGAASQVGPAPSSLSTRTALGGWNVLETDNFRIFHRDPATAPQLAHRAEEARRFAHEKWFGDEPLPNWSPKCDLYLHPTGQDYSLATGVGAQSPGHSKVSYDGGRIIRRLELRADDPNLASAVLPHEITHVVVAGRFGSASLPRWADEGMAVLTEPRDKQEAHLANLATSRHAGSRFSCRAVMTMAEYPPGPEMRDFYAHSVGVCRFLVEQGGAHKLTEFLRVALQAHNYELALRQVYGFASFDAFEASFARYLASLPTQSATLADRRTVPAR